MEKTIATDQLMLWGKAGAESVKLDMLRPGLQRQFWGPHCEERCRGLVWGSEGLGRAAASEVRAGLGERPGGRGKMGRAPLYSFQLELPSFTECLHWASVKDCG